MQRKKDKQKERIALVTGANRGIGFAAAQGLLDQDFQVILLCRNKKSGEAASHKLGEKNTTLIVADTRDEKSIIAAKKHVAKIFGKLDILINNAAEIDNGEATIEQIPTTEFDRIIATNLRGPFLACKHFIPLLKKSDSGRIINVSSEMGVVGPSIKGNKPAYRISKAALNALTSVLAAQLKGTNILVNAVCPGWCKTRMGGSGAHRTAKKGAETILYLATLPNKGPSGRLFRDKKELPFYRCNRLCWLINKFIP
ncbi:SDR family NAD(P)-dependent oxidoreductase [Candidatus Woesearchaeota archaeon]|nr:SDR family NAD(P)-dependent oxidoreductase [Candidatus Woesearchaeota archaeon]